MQSFTQGRGGNPFELPHVHATGHLEALSTLPNRTNLVVLCPSATLELGLARELLFTYGWVSEPSNTIILPFGAATARGSVAAALAAHAATGGRGREVVLDVDLGYRVPLSGEELAAQQAEDEARRAAEQACPLLFAIRC
jgi:hypothetical protein